MKYKEQERLVRDLREFADFYERPQSIELPSVNLDRTSYVTTWSWIGGEYKPDVEKSKSKMRKVVKALGSCEKEWYDNSLHVVKRIGNIKLIFEIAREVVCTKKLTGNKIIHAASTHYSPEEVEEEFEWVCDETSLLA